MPAWRWPACTDLCHMGWFVLKCNTAGRRRETGGTGGDGGRRRETGGDGGSPGWTHQCRCRNMLTP